MHVHHHKLAAQCVLGVEEKRSAPIVLVPGDGVGVANGIAASEDEVAALLGPLPTGRQSQFLLSHVCGLRGGFIVHLLEGDHVGPHGPEDAPEARLSVGHEDRALLEVKIGHRIVGEQPHVGRGRPVDGRGFQRRFGVREYVPEAPSVSGRRSPSFDRAIRRLSL